MNKEQERRQQDREYFIPIKGSAGDHNSGGNDDVNMKQEGRQQDEVFIPTDKKTGGRSEDNDDDAIITQDEGQQEDGDAVPELNNDSNRTFNSSRSQDNGCKADDDEWSEAISKQSSPTSRSVRVTFAGSFVNAPQVSYADSQSEDEDDLLLVSEQSNRSFASYVDTTERLDFLKDDPKEMTRARRLALSLMDKKWYNPHAGKVEANVPTDESIRRFSSSSTHPSLRRGWAYFERITLMRYYETEENKDWVEMSLWERFRYAKTHKEEKLKRAKPGENSRPTKLYDWLSTPHMQLGDFGLGFGIYFSTLRAITWILFLTGMISIFNIHFFASDEYGMNDPETGFTYEGTGHLLRGSAVCTDLSWVPCVDCDCSSREQGWAWPVENTRCFEADLTADRRELDDRVTFVLKNRCLEGSSEILTLGLFNYGVMLFLLPTIYIFLGYYLDRHELIFDKDEQTALDYSVAVQNPPPDATNPRKWKNYFEETFPGVDVVAVTCNLDNDLLVKALVKRREILRRIEACVEGGTDMNIDNLALLAAQEARTRGKYWDPIKALFIPGLPELVAALGGLNTRIKGLAQLDYPCTTVFISFEREKCQRRVLEKLSVGLRYSRNNDPSALEDKKMMFEGAVLHVIEAKEPNEIRWEDANVRFTEQLKQTTVTTIITIGAIFVGAIIVDFAERRSPGIGAAFTISCTYRFALSTIASLSLTIASALNLGFPEVAKFITQYEGHKGESNLQTSLYIKIAAFRWVNTSIIITFITPFTYTLQPGGLISQIAAIFFAEIVTTNVIQLSDAWGHFQRHILAPRAKTQDAMNRWFQGQKIDVAERYTNMTKIMFLAFWYSSIFPAGMLLAAVALSVNYYTDRFSLMRTWQRAPRVGSKISHISLNYFFSLALFFLATMSSFYWSAFPFDNLCPTDQTLNPNVYGIYNVTTTTNTGNKTLLATVDPNTPVYRFCNQDFILRPGGPDFPFIYREGNPDFGDSWMSEEQKILSQLFGYTSLGFIALVALKFLYGIYCRIKLEFYSDYETNGADMGINFHEASTIAGYVPQVKSNLFSYPLIVCDVDNLGDNLLDWRDPDKDYAYYDLTKDLEHIMIAGSKYSKNSFDRVKYWPPNDLKEKLRRKSKMRKSCRSSSSGSLSVDAINV